MIHLCWAGNMDISGTSHVTAFHTTNHQSYLLYINLNVLLKIVTIQIQNQIMHKVKSITHNDQRQLISQLSFLKQGNKNDTMKT